MCYTTYSNYFKRGESAENQIELPVCAIVLAFDRVRMDSRVD